MQKLTRPALAICLCAAALVQTALASSPPTFSTPKFFTATSPAANMVMGDFDGDGIPDVAVYGVVYDASFNGSGSVEVLFGNGTGGFKTASASFTFTNADKSYRGIAAADLDGNGKSDLVLTTGNAVLIYDWNGTEFSATRRIDLTSTGIDATTVAVGDVSAKGSRDIVACDDFGAVGVALISNDGKGNFGAPVTFPTGGVGYYTHPILADLHDPNGNGLADLVLTGGDPGTNNALVGVLLNQGNGTFGAESTYTAPALFGDTNSHAGATASTVADVDGDGKLDLVSACSSLNFTTFDNTYYLTVNLGVGDGTFKEGIAFPFDDGQTTYGFNAIDSADINGDGRADVVTADYTRSGFTVTEWSGSGTSLVLEGQEHFPAFSATYNSFALGYKSTNGSFVTFNKDTNIDVVLGTTSFLSGQVHQVAVYKNTSSGGGGSTVNSLPPPIVKISGTIAPGGDIHFVVSEPSLAGTTLTVRIQYTMDPTNGPWNYLPGGGYLIPDPKKPGTYSFGSGGTSSFPVGSNIFFRAITSASGYTDTPSTKYIGPFTLKLAQLTISVKETSTSDPTGALHIVHIGDKLNYTFTWVNTGNAPAHNLVVMTPVPTYQDASTDLHVQFPKSALSYNQYGHYTNVNGQAQVWWNVADLQPGFSQSVTLTNQTGPQMRLQEQIGLPNNYEVYSTTGLPQAFATGATSGAPNVGDDVLGPFSLTITPDVTSVAPGGLINYTIRITNFSASAISDVVIVDPVPEFANFVSASFVNAKGVSIASPAHSIKVNGKATAINNPLRLLGLYPSNALPVAEQEFLAANPLITMPSDNADELVFYVGTLAKDASVTVHMTAQAIFRPPSDFTDQEIKNFDYMAFFTDSANQVEQSKNEDGNVFTPVSGEVKNAPSLRLVKTVSSTTLSPGDILRVGLAAYNAGPSAADDVIIQDNLPTGADNAILPVLLSTNLKVTITSGSSQQALNSAIAIPFNSSSITMSKANYFVTLDNGNLLTVHGLHVEPNAIVGVTYSMEIPVTTPLKEQLISGTAFIGAKNGNQTPYGTTNIQLISVPPSMPASFPLSIVPNTQLVMPEKPFPIVLTPMPSANPIATATILDALFKKNPSAPLLVTNNHIPSYIPGVQRYLFHYQNVGTTTNDDVHMLIQTPANTEFYRASFWFNGKFVSPDPAKNQSTNCPPRLGSGNVTFDIGALAPQEGGYVMMEVILLPGGVTATAANVTLAQPVLYNGVQPMVAPGKLDDSNSSQFTLYDGKNVPKIGLAKIDPQAVRQGDIFYIQLAVFDYGDIPTLSGAEVTMQAPAGTEIVGVTDEHGNEKSFTPTEVDDALGVVLEHYASAWTIELKATGNPGTTITDNSIVVKIPYYGTLTPNPAAIQIVGTNETPTDNTITTISGAQFVTLGEVAVIPLGQFSAGSGEALVCGPGSQFGGSALDSILSASAVGSLIVLGHASDIPLINLPAVNDMNTAALLLDLPKIVGQAGGNIFNGPADNLIGADGETIWDNDTGGITSTVKALLKAGASSVIASGSGTLPPVTQGGVATVGAGLVSVIGGARILTIGGSVISNDGGSVISNDGGSVIATDSAGVVNTNGSNAVGTDPEGAAAESGPQIASSLTSGAQATTRSGNIVAAGGGNIVAAGGGNIVAAGGGNIVAAGGGNLISGSGGK